MRQSRFSINEETILSASVDHFKTNASVGDTVYIPIILEGSQNNKRNANGWTRASIRSKTPYLAVTIKGTFRWEDVYRWRREYAKGHEN